MEIANASQLYTLTSRTSHSANQNLPKSMPAPAQGKIADPKKQKSAKLKRL